MAEQWRQVAHKVIDDKAFQATIQKQNLTLAYVDTPEFSAAISRQAEAFKKLAPKRDLKQ